jgi:hypothetical protein
MRQSPNVDAALESEGILYVTMRSGETFEMVLMERGRIRMVASSIDSFNQTGLLVADFGGKKQYEVLMQKVGDKVLPVNSDFVQDTKENNLQKVDLKELSKLKEGDTVEILLDTKDTYNQGLSKKDKKDKLVLYVVKNGKLVGVLKDSTGEGDNLSDVDAEIQVQLQALRLDLASQMKSGEIDGLVKAGEIKVNKTLNGRPSFNVTMENGQPVVESKPIDSFNKKAQEKITSLGFIKGGKVVITNGKLDVTKKLDIERSPYVQRYLNNKFVEENPNAVIPVAVITEGGTTTMYPVDVLEDTESQKPESKISEITNTNKSKTKQIQEIQEVMRDVGVDPNSIEYALTPMNFNEETVESIMNKIAGMKSFRSNPESWKGFSVQDISVDLAINLNLNERAFVSPKINLDFRTLTPNIAKYNSESNTTKLSNSAQNKAKDEQKKPC